MEQLQSPQGARQPTANSPEGLEASTALSVSLLCCWGILGQVTVWGWCPRTSRCSKTVASACTTWLCTVYTGRLVVTRDAATGTRWLLT